MIQKVHYSILFIVILSEIPNFTFQKDIIMHFAPIIEAIKTRREVLQVTQKALSDLSGVALGALKKFESGRGNPTLSTLEKLCDALGLEITLTVKKQLINP